VRSFHLVGQVVENQTKVILHQRLDGVGGRDPDTLCNATHTHLVDVGQDRVRHNILYTLGARGARCLLHFFIICCMLHLLAKSKWTASNNIAGLFFCNKILGLYNINLQGFLKTVFSKKHQQV
jgi:hypothetical protein